MPAHGIKPVFTGWKYVCVSEHLGMSSLFLSHPDVCLQRSSDSNGAMADESRYASRKELRLHFFMFSDLVLFARLTGELVGGEWNGGWPR